MTAELPDGYDEEAIKAEARRRRIALETLGDYRCDSLPGRPTLLLGYGRLHEDALRRGVEEVAEVVRAASVASP